MPMARGMQAAAIREGSAERFNVQIVYADDNFEVNYVDGRYDISVHNPNFLSDSDEIVCVYCEIFLKNGNKIVEILRKNDIKTFDETQKKSFDNSPWKLWRGEMLRKAVLKRACKYLPEN
jgi:recombinational DNA repair protein RecT